ncbi:hypothetical protein MKX01_003110 [Papaver californicum]|nr:hypothetical protein MKX01_003110 [Papaver californicum]
MSNPEPVISEGTAADAKYPEADVDGELHPGNTDGSLQEDSVSAQLTSSKEIKEQAEVEEKRKKEDAIHKVTSTVIISGVIVAVIGAIFAVTKKLREN